MNKIVQKLNSMSLILRSRKLFMHISRFKYFKYLQLQNNIKEYIFLQQNTDLVEYKNINSIIHNNKGVFCVFLIDSKSNKLLKLIESVKCDWHIFCTYRSYTFLTSKVQNSKVSQISMRNIYDLNLGNTNKYILDILKDKANLNTKKGLFIITIGIDDKANGYYLDIYSKHEVNNNMNNMIPIGKYLIYVICNFMSIYYLYEIGKNKQSQEKIECNIKFLKKQLLISDLIIKKNKLANE